MAKPVKTGEVQVTDPVKKWTPKKQTQLEHIQVNANNVALEDAQSMNLKSTREKKT